MYNPWTVITVALGATGLILALSAVAQAGDECERAYQKLKGFEQHHRVNSAQALAALQKGDHCSDLVLTFEEQVDANAQAIALFAKAFVGACKNDTSKADDLAFYSLDAVLHPRPSTLRERCESERK